MVDFVSLPRLSLSMFFEQDGGQGDISLLLGGDTLFPRRLGTSLVSFHSTITIINKNHLLALGILKWLLTWLLPACDEVPQFSSTLEAGSALLFKKIYTSKCERTVWSGIGGRRWRAAVRVSGGRRSGRGDPFNSKTID